MNTNKKTNILITGGNGFVGRAVLYELAKESALIDAGEIRILSTKENIEIENISNLNVKYIKGDIRDRDTIFSALEGIDVVLHLAAMVDWGTHKREDVFSVNVDGTKNIIDGCIKNGVKVLVATSSVDVLFAKKPVIDADENTPLPKKLYGAYAESKAVAEQMVQNIESKDLKAAVIRPGGIYGENDPYHLPNLIKMAKKWPFLKIGNKKAKSMHVYCGNIAHAHILLAKELLEGNVKPDREIYFITDNPPENIFEAICPIIEEAGIKIRPKDLWIPVWFLFPVAVLIELFTFIIKPFVQIHPALSRFALNYISTNYTIKTDKAEKDFGYTQKYSNEEALKRTAQWVKNNY
ncbi:MAG: NAD-dependent epimerase/dehydratase family protein [Deltaproteobacteria bacterium]|nr:NAD-dependent epimerase/dehydratase family protein [Deltaproteobacteria bacterium]